jgi:hypothetical protein
VVTEGRKFLKKITLLCTSPDHYAPLCTHRPVFLLVACLAPFPTCFAALFPCSPPFSSLLPVVHFLPSFAHFLPSFCPLACSPPRVSFACCRFSFFPLRLVCSPYGQGLRRFLRGPSLPFVRQRLAVRPVVPVSTACIPSRGLTHPLCVPPAEFRCLLPSGPWPVLKVKNGHSQEAQPFRLFFVMSDIMGSGFIGFHGMTFSADVRRTVIVAGTLLATWPKYCLAEAF